MKHKAHQSEIPGTEQIFNLATETTEDGERTSRKLMQEMLDRKQSALRQVKLFEIAPDGLNFSPR